jgi:serine/threonine-protein kinase
MQQKIGKRQKFGQWILKKHLGDGGNGHVWKAVNSDGEEVAIKFLTNIDGKPYARFRDEVNVILKNSDIDGILPIIDYYLPEKPEDNFPWYAMPVAQTIDDYLADKDFDEIIHAIEKIAQTLSELHKRNISHRDIKPANLLVKDEKFYLADFGLVDYPEKLDLTSTDENIGAKWTMAPEMRRNGHEADGKPADVYSLAKTLWILLTKKKKGFDGQYFGDGANGLKNFSIPVNQNHQWNSGYLEFTKPLDDLLSACTNDEPTSRPSIENFCKKIVSIVLETFDIFLMWQTIQKKLFPEAVPTRIIWEDKAEIVQVLNLLGKHQINHMLFPTGGGLDLYSASLGKEPETIELVTDKEEIGVELIKPKRLIFEYIDNSYEWNYFRLETDELAPTGTEEVFRNQETLVELDDTEYIEGYHWNTGIYEDKKLPSNARVVVRHIHGTFLIVQKVAVYNHTDSYDGLHNHMTTDEFRNYVLRKSQLYQQIITNEEVIKKSTEIDITPRDWAIGYLRQEASKESKKYWSQDDDLFSDLED